jgi:type I restriction enzyme M protein
LLTAEGDPGKFAAQASSELMRLSLLQSRITPLQAEINQLTRQFWVTKDQVKANKYDLSASRYRQIEQDETYYDPPAVTLSRMKQLETLLAAEVDRLGELVK